MAAVCRADLVVVCLKVAEASAVECLREAEAEEAVITSGKDQALLHRALRASGLPMVRVDSCSRDIRIRGKG